MLTGICLFIDSEWIEESGLLSEFGLVSVSTKLGWLSPLRRLSRFG